MLPHFDRLFGRGKAGHPRRAVKAGARRTSSRLSLESLEDKTLMASGVIPGSTFLTGPQAGQPLNIAIGYLQQNAATYGISGADLSRSVVTNNYTDDGIGTTHIYLRQGFNGVGVFDRDININIAADGSVINAGGGFEPGLGTLPSFNSPPVTTLSSSRALASAATLLNQPGDPTTTVVSPAQGVEQVTVLSAPGVASYDVNARLQYVVTEDGTRLSWEIPLASKVSSSYYDAYIDATTGALLHVDDWTDYYSSSYNVQSLANHTRSPDDGDRVLVTNPDDPFSSPYGWHNVGTTSTPTSTTTSGNNTNAYEDRDADNQPGFQPDGGAALKFDFPLDLASAPTVYQAAAITNLFYWTNISHDIWYHYGFTEVAGNYQVNNYSKGGAGADPVLAEAQDGSALNNANFSSTPDGTSGRVQMFEFNLTSPNRDGDLDPEVIVHELGHGLSNRLTGGAANAGALQNTQSGGMGEGWSDFWSLAFLVKPGDTKNTARPTGNYVIGQPSSGGGIRRFPYSYDMSVNPQTIADYNTDSSHEVHNTGEIWAQTLWDMYWNLVDKYGADDDLYAGTGGNNIAIQLIIDGMKLQPANPTFAQARDAILQADLNRYGGENAPQIWGAFARRGMGLSFNSGADSNATTVTPATDVPQFLTLTAVPVAAQKEATAFSNVVLATLSDPEDLPLGTYNASVDWGDGNPAGSVSLSRTSAGKFSVLGSHTYGEGGNYRITVTVTKTTTGRKVAVTDAVHVDGLPLIASGTAISLNEGDTYGGLLATFTDSAYDPQVATSVPRDPSYFSAIISYPDGTNSFGSVTSDSKGVYQVYDTSGYRLGGGDYDVTIAISDPGFSVAAITHASVIDSPLLAAPLVISTIEGQTYTSAVAVFSDADPRAPGASNYFATIDWGDGTQSTSASGVVIRANPLGDGFIVTGSHVFAYGEHPVNVSIGNRSGNNTAQAVSTAEVANAPLSSQGLDVSATAGTPFREILARFTDADTRPNPASHYLAAIDWGDGSSDYGEIVPNSDGGYFVYGSHAYRGGGYPVTTRILDVDGAESFAASTAVIADAPTQLILNPTYAPREGTLPAQDIIAFVTTANLLALPTDYAATIRYGDGTTGPGRVEGTAGGGTFTVKTDKVYSRAGSYPYSVALTSLASGSVIQALGNVTVSAAPVTVTALPIQSVSKTPVSAIPVATFTSENPLAQASSYSASINWGDGKTSVGTITPDGQGGFHVAGDHTYLGGGTYAVVVTVGGLGISASASTTAGVDDLLTPLSGQSSVGNVATSNTQPVFSGRAEPLATVQILAIPTSGGASFVVGTGQADAQGNYAIQSTPLSDGKYGISASAKDNAGKPSSPLTPLYPSATTGLLTIDTQGPKVSDVTLNPRSGKVTVVLNDGVSGLGAGATDVSNYTLRSSNGRTYRLTDLDVISGSPTSGAATLVFSSPRRLARGTYVLTIDASGVRDQAGNALDERYFVPFPGIYKQTGQDYVAAFRSNGRRATVAQQFVPPGEVLAARKHRKFIRSHFRNG